MSDAPKAPPAAPATPAAPAAESHPRLPAGPALPLPVGRRRPPPGANEAPAAAAPTAASAPAAPAPRAAAPAPQPQPAAPAQQPAARNVTTAGEAIAARRAERAAGAGAEGGQPPAAAPKPAAQPAAKPAGGDDDPFAALMARAQGGETGSSTEAAAQPAGAPVVLNGTGSYTLKVGDRTETMTAAELTRHVGLSQDYTRKTQEISAAAAELHRGQSALNEVLPIVLPYIERLVNEGTGGLGEEPDWIKLAETDPGGYITAKARWDGAMAEKGKLDRVREAQTREGEVARAARLAEGHKVLVRELPGWEDSTKRQAMQTAIASYARKHGYPDGEIASIAESRHVLTLTKAMLYDRLMAGATSAAPTPPAVPRGGLPPPNSARVETAEANFAARPSATNAGALIAARRNARR